MTDVNFKEISAFEGPEESPGFLLWRASTLWRRAIENVLKPLQLTHPQFVVLASAAWLTRKGHEASQIEIARQAGLDPNTTSQILKSLEKKHLIERKKSRDERRKLPGLTGAGAHILAKAMPIVEQADAEFFSSVNLKTATALTALQELAK